MIVPLSGTYQSAWFPQLYLLYSICPGVSLLLGISFVLLLVRAFFYFRLQLEKLKLFLPLAFWVVDYLYCYIYFWVIRIKTLLAKHILSLEALVLIPKPTRYLEKYLMYSFNNLLPFRNKHPIMLFLLVDESVWQLLFLEKRLRRSVTKMIFNNTCRNTTPQWLWPNLCGVHCMQPLRKLPLY